MFICLCHAVSEGSLKEIIETEGVASLKDLKTCSKAGSDCGKCLCDLKQIISEAASDQNTQKRSRR